MWQIIKKIKFRYAIYLDRKDETYCWVNLAMWAMGYRSFWSLFIKNHEENDYHNQLCPKCGYAYCGKCQKKIDNLKEGKQ